MQMSYNGSGTFVINSTGQPVVTGTVISSTAFNALTADLATGLSTALTKDGQTTPTANLPMGTFKFTGLSAGSAATDSANIAQVQNSFGSFLTVAGTDTITATVSPSLTAYAAGQMFAFVAANTNTGAVTINISSLGAKSITKTGTTALVAGDLTANYLYVVVYDGTQFQVVGVSATTFTDLTVSGVLTLSGAGVQLTSSGTGAWKMPVGTTAQRPSVPASGMIRQNSTTGNPEWYDTTSSQWLQFTQAAGYSVNYLVVAGGASGAATGASSAGSSGGGGAGGLLTSTTTLSSGIAYTITVGAGGAAISSSADVKGNSGSNSSIASLAIAIGGGAGGAGGSFSPSSGGSGGGAGTTLTGGAGTTGQGYSGGNGATNGSGGGGGASASGTSASGNTGGAGGAGASNSISGSPVTYAGGGGAGASNTASAGSGGAGGGGAGGANLGNGTNGTANTGGGGGASGSGAGITVTSGSGGSGIVIISYLGSQRGTGGTVTSSGGYTIHTFTSSGTYSA
jgi:hypothetical protein